jgi:thioredoxin-like negative regulator of GroEL
MNLPIVPFMQAPHKRMRFLTFKALLFAATSVGMSSASLAANPYWDEYGELPVFIQQIRAHSEQTLKFVGFEGDRLIAEMEIDGRIGEMSVPVSETMASNFRFDLAVMEEAKLLVRKQKFSDATELLRPKVYPLIKFHQVPEILGEMHSAIRTLLDSVISQGELAEADDLIKRLALDKIDLKYSEIAIRLMEAHIEAEDFKAAARIAKALPKHDEYSVNISPVIKAADALRGAGNYEAVIPLYREIVDIVPAAVRTDIRMWLAYSLVLAERVDEASPIIDSMQEPAATERSYSLYKLLQGSRDHRKENYKNALDVLTRGFVRAQTSYVWVPEMLYLIGDCYAKTEAPMSARNVWSEIKILYPDSPWAKNAADAIEKLPKERLLDLD